MGINGIKAASTVSAPFFGLIGTKEVLYAADAQEINEAFYGALRNDEDIRDFIEKADGRWGDNLVRGLTSEFWTKHRAGEFGSPRTP